MRGSSSDKELISMNPILRKGMCIVSALPIAAVLVVGVLPVTATLADSIFPLGDRVPVHTIKEEYVPFKGSGQIP